MRMIIDLARALDLEVVAEGIESAEQLEALRDLGCELGQGFYLAPPLSTSTSTTRVRARNAASRPALSYIRPKGIAVARGL